MIAPRVQHNKPSLDRLRRRVSILNLCAEHGIALDRRDGSDLIGRCPFHDEDEPSFIVSPRVNRWRCTRCGRGGGIVLLLMQIEHLSHAQAIDRLLILPGLIDRASHVQKGGDPCRA